jgi:hypothetical protein
MQAKRKGWIRRTVVIRPKTRLFAVLSVAWCLVSFTPATLLFSHQIAWTSTIGIVSWLFILPSPVFILLAFVFGLTEHPKTMKQTIPDPNYDLRDLY